MPRSPAKKTIRKQAFYLVFPFFPTAEGTASLLGALRFENVQQWHGKITLADGELMAQDGKMQILEAMCRLCETRPFSRLGVVDIAREANMSRSGFYYHFTDRNAAVQWLSRSAFAAGIDEIGRTRTWFDGHYTTTRILMQFRPLIIAAARDNGYASAEMSYLRHRKANLCETLALRNVEVTDELLFQIEALATAEQHMTSAYIEGRLGTMTPRTFCEMLVNIIPEQLRQATEPPGAS